MDDVLLSKALIELADLAICTSGDFHCLHLNVTGAEFDTLHRKVLQKYYEEAVEDYDDLAEKARMYHIEVPNKNEAVSRISYKSWVPTQPTLRAEVVSRCSEIIEQICEQYSTVYNAFNKVADCAKAIGIANFLQGRIEYWSKEAFYFNQSRVE